MSHFQQCELLSMFRTGRFSIKEIAAHVGVYEWTVADYLIAKGAIRRLPCAYPKRGSS